jgi:hypothetical protein
MATPLCAEALGQLQHMAQRNLTSQSFMLQLSLVWILLQGWEAVWLCSLGAESHAAGHPNLTWLPPLWSSRDPVVRSAGLQLVAGFCSSRRGCAQLLPGLPTIAGSIWSAGLRSHIHACWLSNADLWNKCGIFRALYVLIIASCNYLNIVHYISFCNMHALQWFAAVCTSHPVATSYFTIFFHRSVYTTNFYNKTK